MGLSMPGYTTFSTFIYETVRLLEDRAWRYAAWNLLLSGPLSFSAGALGYIGTIRFSGTGVAWVLK
ncbi:MAG: hypothetical protein ACRDJK_13460 [Actinomycetota bacterium]